MTANLKAIGAILGLAIFAIGLVGATGIVPGFSVVTGPGGVQFSLSASGYNATVTDQSAFGTGCVAFGYGGFVSWGDGAQSYMRLTTGGTFSHTYTSAGNRTVSDTWTVQCNIHQPPKKDVASTTLVIPQTGTTNPIKDSPNFAWSTSSLVVTFTDQSTSTSPTVITGTSWSFGDGGVASGSQGSVVQHTFASVGSYKVTDYVNATNGQTRGTSSVTQTVVLTSPPQLQVSINGPSNIKVNGTGVFTVSATGGVAPYTYAFAPKTYTGTQNGATYTISPTTLGTGTVIAVVTDSVGSKGTTSTASYTVTTSNTSNALAATIVGASSIPTNVPSIFTVTATGGVAPYTYSFTSTISGSQTGATYSITPATTGAGTIYAVVKDSAGNNITTSSFAFTITQGPTCGTPTTPACSTGGGSTPPPGYNAVTGLFMLAGLGIFAMVLIPGPIWIRVLGGVLIAVAGIVSGGFIGGWGWL